MFSFFLSVYIQIDREPPADPGGVWGISANLSEKRREAQYRRWRDEFTFILRDTGKKGRG
jgi:hypothetical protein